MLKEKAMPDNYETKCKTCGERRGSHYSTSKYGHMLIFCTQTDLQRYLDTSIIQGKRFIPDYTPKKYSCKPEIVEDTMVIMVKTDTWAKEGQIGIVRSRDNRSAKISWYGNGIYFHPLDRISLLKEAKDPNILFLLAKLNRTM
jgi:hypothetical protein